MKSNNKDIKTIEANKWINKYFFNYHLPVSSWMYFLQMFLDIFFW